MESWFVELFVCVFWVLLVFELPFLVVLLTFGLWFDLLRFVSCYLGFGFPILGMSSLVIILIVGFYAIYVSTGFTGSCDVMFLLI